ncbi:putative uncharacterized protein DDB_G0282133 isoform X2 [Nematostella vectensis]|uniref:putative uncharacterized protein DDB_G0282133 isoform X2 n=1 Tax=Nematostella vectensis TaxID=45351 RepID=UPI002076D7F8|nr:putative uncharacterized protein DDB_G0282133 isoform X2 [Nematostella vectensis]
MRGYWILCLLVGKLFWSQGVHAKPGLFPLSDSPALDITSPQDDYESDVYKRSLLIDADKRFAFARNPDTIYSENLGEYPSYLQDEDDDQFDDGPDTDLPNVWEDGDSQNVEQYQIGHEGVNEHGGENDKRKIDPGASGSGVGEINENTSLEENSSNAVMTIQTVAKEKRKHDQGNENLASHRLNESRERHQVISNNAEGDDPGSGSGDTIMKTSDSGDTIADHTNHKHREGSDITHEKHTDTIADHTNHKHREGSDITHEKHTGGDGSGEHVSEEDAAAEDHKKSQESEEGNISSKSEDRFTKDGSGEGNKNSNSDDTEENDDDIEEGRTDDSKDDSVKFGEDNKERPDANKDDSLKSRDNKKGRTDDSKNDSLRSRDDKKERPVVNRDDSQSSIDDKEKRPDVNKDESQRSRDDKEKRPDINKDDSQRSRDDKEKRPDVNKDDSQSSIDDKEKRPDVNKDDSQRSRDDKEKRPDINKDDSQRSRDDKEKRPDVNKDDSQSSIDDKEKRPDVNKQKNEKYMNVASKDHYMNKDKEENRANSDDDGNDESGNEKTNSDKKDGNDEGLSSKNNDEKYGEGNKHEDTELKSNKDDKKDEDTATKDDRIENKKPTNDYEKLDEEDNRSNSGVNNKDWQEIHEYDKTVPKKGEEDKIDEHREGTSDNIKSNHGKEKDRAQLDLTGNDNKNKNKESKKYDEQGDSRPVSDMSNKDRHQNQKKTGDEEIEDETDASDKGGASDQTNNVNEGFDAPNGPGVLMTDEKNRGKEKERSDAGSASPMGFYVLNGPWGVTKNGGDSNKKAENAVNTTSKATKSEHSSVGIKKVTKSHNNKESSDKYGPGAEQTNKHNQDTVDETSDHDNNANHKGNQSPGENKQGATTSQTQTTILRKPKTDGKKDEDKQSPRQKSRTDNSQQAAKGHLKVEIKSSKDQQSPGNLKEGYKSEKKQNDNSKNSMHPEIVDFLKLNKEQIESERNGGSNQINQVSASKEESEDNNGVNRDGDDDDDVDDDDDDDGEKVSSLVKNKHTGNLLNETKRHRKAGKNTPDDGSRQSFSNKKASGSATKLDSMNTTITQKLTKANQTISTSSNKGESTLNNNLNALESPENKYKLHGPSVDKTDHNTTNSGNSGKENVQMSVLVQKLQTSKSPKPVMKIVVDKKDENKGTKLHSTTIHPYTKSSRKINDKSKESKDVSDRVREKAAELMYLIERGSKHHKPHKVSKNYKNKAKKNHPSSKISDKLREDAPGGPPPVATHLKGPPVVSGIAQNTMTGHSGNLGSSRVPSTGYGANPYNKPYSGYGHYTGYQQSTGFGFRPSPYNSAAYLAYKNRLNTMMRVRAARIAEYNRYIERMKYKKMQDLARYRAVLKQKGYRGYQTAYPSKEYWGSIRQSKNKGFYGNKNVDSTSNDYLNNQAYQGSGYQGSNNAYSNNGYQGYSNANINNQGNINSYQSNGYQGNNNMYGYGGNNNAYMNNGYQGNNLYTTNSYQGNNYYQNKGYQNGYRYPARYGNPYDVQNLMKMDEGEMQQMMKEMDIPMDDDASVETMPAPADKPVSAMYGNTSPQTPVSPYNAFPNMATQPQEGQSQQTAALASFQDSQNSKKHVAQEPSQNVSYEDLEHSAEGSAIKPGDGKTEQEPKHLEEVQQDSLNLTSEAKNSDHVNSSEQNPSNDSSYEKALNIMKNMNQVPQEPKTENNISTNSEKKHSETNKQSDLWSDKTSMPSWKNKPIFHPQGVVDNFFMNSPVLFKSKEAKSFPIKSDEKKKLVETVALLHNIHKQDEMNVAPNLKKQSSREENGGKKESVISLKTLNGGSKKRQRSKSKGKFETVGYFGPHLSYTESVVPMQKLLKELDADYLKQGFFGNEKSRVVTKKGKAMSERLFEAASMVQNSVYGKSTQGIHARPTEPWYPRVQPTYKGVKPRKGLFGDVDEDTVEKCKSIGKAEFRTKCPKGWVAHNEFCYGIFTSKSKFEVFPRECAKYNAILAMPKTEEELGFLHSHLKSRKMNHKAFHLGLTRRSDSWSWADDSPFVMSQSFSDVFTDKSRKGVSCGVLRNGRIRSERCEARRPFICEVKRGMEAVRILAFGDSLTKGFYGGSGSYHPYTSKLEFLLNKDSHKCYIIDNQGKDQETAASMTKRLKHYLNKVTKWYSWVIILGGTNDIIHDKRDSTEKNWDKIVHDIIAAHREAHKRGFNTVVVTIPETDCEETVNEYCHKTREERKYVNERLRRYAVETGAAVLSDLAIMLPRYSMGNEKRNFFWETGLHLRPQGYDRMAEIIYDDLVRNLLE